MAFWMMTDDGENLDELFGSSMPRLFRAADCILHNYHDSEDALQDGLLSALRHIDQFKGNSQFSTWLFSIIRNCALAKLRKQHAHPYISIDEHNVEGDAEFCSLEMPADPRPDPERACAQAELSFQFAQTLEGLPASYRAIIRLCDFEGFSGKEAAQRLGLSVSALKAQHHRARRAIRELMGAHAARRIS
jgi:RNA polymerase sigma-70 factor (ECF subfamily)